MRTLAGKKGIVTMLGSWSVKAETDRRLVVWSAIVPPIDACGILPTDHIPALNPRRSDCPWSWRFIDHLRAATSFHPCKSVGDSC